MKDIYIVYGREDGAAVIPEVFYDEKSAWDAITKSIADDVINDFQDELLEDEINLEDAEAVVEWGESKDYCYENCYMYSSEWHELDVVKKTVES